MLYRDAIFVPTHPRSRHIWIKVFQAVADRKDDNSTSKGWTMKIYSNKFPESQGPNYDRIERLKEVIFADKATINDRSGAIAEIMSAIDRLAEVRRAKVQDIEWRVNAGVYVVDPLKVAEKILNDL